MVSIRISLTKLVSYDQILNTGSEVHQNRINVKIEDILADNKQIW